MNNNSLIFLEKKRIEDLKKDALDGESIKKYKDSIDKVSSSDATRLGKELLDMISKKGYNDDSYQAEKLIKQGADVSYKNDKKGDFPLIVCARKGYFRTFKLLLKAGADVNETNNYFTTTLMAAARHGNLAMVSILINMGADVNARCLDGDSALMSAKRHDQKDCFDALVAAQAHLNNRNLANESLLDIPGSVYFDLSLLEDSGDSIVKTVSDSDAKDLVEEAIQKLKTFKTN